MKEIKNKGKNINSKLQDLLKKFYCKGNQLNIIFQNGKKECSIIKNNKKIETPIYEGLDLLYITRLLFLHYLKDNSKDFHLESDYEGKMNLRLKDSEIISIVKDYDPLENLSDLKKYDVYGKSYYDENKYELIIKQSNLNEKEYKREIVEL